MVTQSKIGTDPIPNTTIHNQIKQKRRAQTRGRGGERGREAETTHKVYIDIQRYLHKPRRQDKQFMCSLRE